MSINLSDISASGPIKLTACVLTEHLARFAAIEIFRPAWLEKLRGMSVLRFMDWQGTNNSTQREWSDRPRPSSFTYSRGAPVEIMVALTNAVGADPWFCIPHLADDDYINRFASAVLAGLNANLTAQYEYSNEVWNFIFGQAKWAQQQAERLWPGQGDGWMQFYGARASEMAALIDTVYAGTTGASPQGHLDPYCMGGAGAGHAGGSAMGGGSRQSTGPSAAL